LFDATAYDDAYHAVVTENVRQPRLQGKPVRIALDIPHFAFRITARGEVELIRLVDELRNPLTPGFVKRLNCHHHLKRSKISRQITRILAQERSPAVAAVEFRTPSVFVRIGDGFEVAACEQRTDIEGRVCRQFGYRHLG
jgi:hypothetical protein